MHAFSHTGFKQQPPPSVWRHAFLQRGLERFPHPRLKQQLTSKNGPIALYIFSKVLSCSVWSDLCSEFYAVNSISQCAGLNLVWDHRARGLMPSPVPFYQPERAMWPAICLLTTQHVLDGGFPKQQIFRAISNQETEAGEKASSPSALCSIAPIQVWLAHERAALQSQHRTWNTCLMVLGQYTISSSIHDI